MRPPTHPGPHLRLAALCQEVIHEADGTVSIRNLFTGWPVISSPVHPRGDASVRSLGGKVVVAFGAGGFVGKKRLQVYLMVPGIEPTPVIDTELEFKSPDALVVFDQDITLKIDQPLRIFFEVLIGGTFATRIEAEIKVYRGLA